MLARAKQVTLTIEELNTTLTGYTNNGVIDTIPEIVDYINNASTQPIVDFNPISTEDIDLICI